MAHSLSRFSKSILEQPQLITQQRFEEIASLLEDRNNGLYQAAVDAQVLADKNGVSPQEDLSETTVGVLRIDGALTNKPTMFQALCGGTSYQDLMAQTDELCAMDNINTIFMDVDSGGGEAYNCFISATYIKDKVSASGKKLIAYIDGMSASAAYAYTTIADEVVIHPDAMAGSIGVVVRLVNDNQAQKDAGLETTYITAGDSKVPFEKDGGFREDYLADIQDRVTEMYGNFVSHVALNRDISEEVVRGTEAKMFSATKAIELGLVDKIMTREEFFEYLADQSEDKETKAKGTSSVLKLETPSAVEETPMSDNLNASVDVEQMAELKAQLALLQETTEAQAALLATVNAEKAEAEKATLAEQLSGFAFLADSSESVLAFLCDANVDDTHKALLNSVLGEAQAGISKVEEKAVEDIASAQLATDKAIEEKDLIKQEFGEKEHASTEAPVEELSHKDSLAQKVAARKAELAASKNKA